MANWNAKRDPLPDKKDNTVFKNFIRQKYVERKFMEAPPKDDSEDSDEVKEKKKKSKSRKTKK